MLKFYLTADSQTYRQTLFDIIRIFDCQFQWAEDGTGIRLAVETGADQWQLEVGEEILSWNTQGLDENQCRRLLKDTLYGYLLKLTGTEGHPWGMMTGIRPTKIVHRYWEQGMGEAEIRQALAQDYHVQLEKQALLLDVTQRQRQVLAQTTTAGRVSLYLSIPFCPTRCAYCSFPSFALPKPHLQEEYLTHLLAEYQAVCQALQEQGTQVQTIYIGGGTPTSLSAAQLGRLLEGIGQGLRKQRLEEFTVEAGRPDTITQEKLQVLKQYGVSRISINPQSFSQATLDAIGRRHTVEQLLEQYQLARAIGFDSINMDLITGLTGETVQDFAYSLEQIGRLQPENLTVHALAIKRTSALRDTILTDPQAQLVQEMHNYLQQWLQSQAYVPYYLYRQKSIAGNQENVGYCLPGKESLYNILMMEERQTILGLGVGSATKLLHQDGTLHQTNNPKDLYFYNQRIQEIIQRRQQQIAELLSS